MYFGVDSLLSVSTLHRFSLPPSGPSRALSGKFHNMLQPVKHRSPCRTATVLVVSVLWFVARVDGHAELLVPSSRNMDPASRLASAYCPHCGNSGGGAIVQSRIAAFEYPVFPDVGQSEGTHGLCGDPFQTLARGDGYIAPPAEQPFMKRGPVKATYLEGAEVELWVGVSANHRGFFEFRICEEGIDVNTPSQAAGQACLEKHVLERVDPATRPECDGADISAMPDCQPLDTVNPTRWYLPPQELARPSLGAATATHAYFTMKFRLPAGLRCAACTMQWYYMTANSCHPPGERDYYRGAFSQANNPWGFITFLPGCSLQAQSEQFWNCADIAILDGEAYNTTQNQADELPVQDEQDGENTQAEWNSENTQDEWNSGYQQPSISCPAGIPNWGTCYSGSACCQGGVAGDFVCARQHQWYAQCRPVGDCPAGWDCTVLDVLDVTAADSEALVTTEDVESTPAPQDESSTPAAKNPGPSCPTGIANWDPCDGSVCCAAGVWGEGPFQCLRQNEFYSQCRPVGDCPDDGGWECTVLGSTEVMETSTAEIVVDTTACPTGISNWGSCDGSVCCEDGVLGQGAFQCVRQHLWFAQCRPVGDCPLNWECTILDGSPDESATSTEEAMDEDVTTTPTVEEEEVTTTATPEDEDEVTTTPTAEEEEVVTTTPTPEEEEEVTTTPTPEEEEEVTTTPTVEEEAEATTTPTEEEDEVTAAPMVEEEEVTTTPTEEEEEVTTTPTEEEEEVTTTAAEEEEVEATTPTAKEEEEVTTTPTEEEEEVTTTPTEEEEEEEVTTTPTTTPTVEEEEEVTTTPMEEDEVTTNPMVEEEEVTTTPTEEEEEEMATTPTEEEEEVTTTAAEEEEVEATTPTAKEEEEVTTTPTEEEEEVTPTPTEEEEETTTQATEEEEEVTTTPMAEEEDVATTTPTEEEEEEATTTATVVEEEEVATTPTVEEEEELTTTPTGEEEVEVTPTAAEEHVVEMTPAPVSELGANGRECSSYGEWSGCLASLCCAEGLVCSEQNKWYAQCLKPGDCAGLGYELAGWTCATLSLDSPAGCPGGARCKANVKFSATLSMTVAQFNAKRGAYSRAVAQALGVDDSAVILGEIVSRASGAGAQRRALLAAFIEVPTTVVVSQRESTTATTKVVEKLDEELEKSGMTVTEVSAVEVETFEEPNPEATTPTADGDDPTPAVDDVRGRDSEAVFVRAGAAGGAALLVLLFAAFGMWWCRGRNLHQGEQVDGCSKLSQGVAAPSEGRGFLDLDRLMTPVHAIHKLVSNPSPAPRRASQYLPDTEAAMPTSRLTGVCFLASDASFSESGEQLSVISDSHDAGQTAAEAEAAKIEVESDTAKLQREPAAANIEVENMLLRSEPVVEPVEEYRAQWLAERRRSDFKSILSPDLREQLQASGSASASASEAHTLISDALD